MSKIEERIKNAGVLEIIRLRCKDDNLLFLPGLHGNKIGYILFVNEEVLVDGELSEKYNRAVVKNFYKKKQKEDLCKILGMKKGIKEFEKLRKGGEYILYTPDFPSKRAILKKVKELMKEVELEWIEN